MLTYTFIQSTPAIVLAVITFLLILGCYAVGHHRRSILLKKYPDQVGKDTSTMTGALLAAPEWLDQYGWTTSENP